jgi:hypothetical protein
MMEKIKYTEGRWGRFRGVRFRGLFATHGIHTFAGYMMFARGEDVRGLYPKRRKIALRRMRAKVIKICGITGFRFDRHRD